MVSLVVALPVYASPASKQREAAAVKRQIDALDVKLETASEEYNGAKERLDKATAKRKSSEQKLANTRAELDVVMLHFNDRAVDMYRGGGNISYVEVLFGSSDFKDFSSMWDLLQDMSKEDGAKALELKKLQAELDKLTAELKAQEKVAAEAEAAMKKNKKSIEKQLAERKAKLRGLEAEVAALYAAEARRTSGGGSTSGGRKTFPAPTRAPRSEVVNIAKRYLGAPYKWAANGPNSFDCSGLTVFVYKQVGVSLPRTSRSQINVGQRVSKAHLKPGDLVFFGSPIRHVGIYVGNNQYLHAPRTGDVVKISSLASRKDFAGATRP